LFPISKVTFFRFHKKTLILGCELQKVPVYQGLLGQNMCIDVTFDTILI